MRFTSVLSLLGLSSVMPAVVVLGATQTVMVGMGTQLVFSPSNITADMGDTINFVFMALGKNHSATQSSFADPCVPLADGANSGFLPVPANASFTNETAPTWSIMVNTTNPKSHCQAGMVFSINATPQKTFEAFLANAMNSTATAAPAAGTTGGSSATSPAGSPSPDLSSLQPGSSASAAEENQPPSTSGSMRLATTPKTALGLLAIHILIEEYLIRSPNLITMFTKIITAVSLFVAVAHGIDHPVVVGMNGTLTFQPDSISADVNDTVTFQFVSKNHTVTQSTFKDPCDKEPNGFDEPFNQVVTNTTTQFPIITLLINDTRPVWVYCPQKIGANHCQRGMVFAINPLPNATFEQFQANAINSGNTSASTNSTSSGNGTDSGSNSTTSGGSPKSGAMQVQLSGVMGLLAAIGSNPKFHEYLCRTE
ncbi:hypothetical protein Clacol_006820 [Clathrus columnatus]|uniref:Cupredoxin n=1 Tax=Clathrus columnatus TaxID=1419009 RepID=A0AAV5AFR5_9AGAM|nr:hypothetical protein Clacol_006820 [Clathrus columnatus]